jgi:hypothetical protein
MNTENKRYLTYDEAVWLLPDEDEIHTFVSEPFLIGADWSRKDILDKLKKSTIELSGPGASAMGHGIAAYTVDGKSYKGLLFIETNAEKLAEFQAKEDAG